ncbi:MAG: energy transducer TonB family protein [Weeksellaceae bacterium]
MNLKKSKTSTVERQSTIFFLIGLNAVLLTVWFIFGTQSEIVKVENELVEISDDYSSAIVIEYETPEVEKTEVIEEPLPEPEIDLTLIDEVPDVLPEDEVILKPIDKVKLPETTSNKFTYDPDAFQKLKEKAEGLKEENILKPVSPSKVTYMAIYPGCEKYKGDRRKLTNCFGMKLAQDISNELDTTYPDVDKDELKVQLEFKVDTEGNIINIVSARGDEELKSQAKEALEKVARKLRKSKKQIVPAKMSDDSYAILKMTNAVVLKKGN